MGFGVDAFTIATHVLRVAVLALVAWRVMRTFRFLPVLEQAERHGLSAAAALACVTLIIERLWAIAARAARSQGVDLLGMHPAPELVGGLVAIGTYAFCGPLLVAQMGRARAASRVLAEWSGLLLLWAVVATLLH